MSNRQQDFENWLIQQCQQPSIDVQPLAKDASFRRYFTLSHDKNWLAVDAPPEHEKNHEFISVARLFSQKGVRVPAIKAYDLEQGFLLVENLGRDSYLKVLQARPELADRLYREAIDKLIDIVTVEPAEMNGPHFDRSFLQAELDNFTDWYLQQYKGLTLTEADKTMLQSAYDFLIRRAESQPQVCIHRDYHSRNLIVRETENPGVIDFQDAMIGPLTYDLVSLLRDAYVAWPRDQVETWARVFYQAYQQRHPEYTQAWPDFLDDFNLMGIQRHLKAIFIFARKWLRDKDEGYLNDIPRTLQYVLTVSQSYPELNAFRQYLEAHS